MEPVLKKKEYLYEIGDNLRNARMKRGLSQDGLANSIDSDRKAVSRYELGEIEMGLLTFCQYAESLHADPKELLPKSLIVPSAQGDPESEAYIELINIARGLSERDLEALVAAARVMNK